MVTDWMVARQFQVIEHPPYSPDLTSADSLSLSEEGAGRPHLHSGDLKEGVGGCRQNMYAADFFTAFRGLEWALWKMCWYCRVLHRKKLRINVSLIIFVFLLRSSGNHVNTTYHLVPYIFTVDGLEIEILYKNTVKNTQIFWYWQLIGLDWFENNLVSCSFSYVHVPIVFFFTPPSPDLAWKSLYHSS